MMNYWQANRDSERRQYAAFRGWCDQGEEFFYSFIESHRTPYRILYERDDGGVSAVHPSPVYMAMLRTGGIVRRMRVICDDKDRRPIFDGDGALLGPMTEEEAMIYLIWRDVPYDIHKAHSQGNRARIALGLFEMLPPTREERDSWRWDGEGRILIDRAA